jgi:hypothetical protein
MGLRCLIEVSVWLCYVAVVLPCGLRLILLVMHSVQEEEGMNGMRHGLLIPLDMDPPCL